METFTLFSEGPVVIWHRVKLCLLWLSVTLETYWWLVNIRIQCELLSGVHNYGAFNCLHLIHPSPPALHRLSVSLHSHGALYCPLWTQWSNGHKVTRFIHRRYRTSNPKDIIGKFWRRSEGVASAPSPWSLYVSTAPGMWHWNYFPTSKWIKP